LGGGPRGALAGLAVRLARAALARGRLGGGARRLAVLLERAAGPRPRLVDGRAQGRLVGVRAATSQQRGALAALLAQGALGLVPLRAGVLELAARRVALL